VLAALEARAAAPRVRRNPLLSTPLIIAMSTFLGPRFVGEAMPCRTGGPERQTPCQRWVAPESLTIGGLADSVADRVVARENAGRSRRTVETARRCCRSARQ
jgi:hypothetical protein